MLACFFLPSPPALYGARLLSFVLETDDQIRSLSFRTFQSPRCMAIGYYTYDGCARARRVVSFENGSLSLFVLEILFRLWCVGCCRASSFCTMNGCSHCEPLHHSEHGESGGGGAIVGSSRISKQTLPHFRHCKLFLVDLSPRNSQTLRTYAGSTSRYSLSISLFLYAVGAMVVPSTLHCNMWSILYHVEVLIVAYFPMSM